MAIMYLGIFLIGFSMGIFSWGFLLFIQDLIKEDKN